MARIVIADDHALMRAGLRRILEATGHVVVGEAGDGLEVASVVRKTTPDVLVLDLGMPGMHGLDILRAIGHHLPATRVLVVSAYDRDDFVIGAIRAGAAGYVLKAAGTAELLNALDEVARGGYYVSPQLSAVVARGLCDKSGSDPVDPYDKLTPRERQVFMLMAEGWTNVQIGKRLFIAPRTAEGHRLSVMRKLGLSSQTDVVLYAVKRGLVG